jgi:hypothetical protein
MKNWNSFAGLAAFASVAVCAPQVASAEEIFRQTQGVSCLPDGTGCAQFQGYIYVHRKGEAAPAAPVWDAAGAKDVSDMPVGERRFYLSLGAAEAH